MKDNEEETRKSGNLADHGHQISFSTGHWPLPLVHDGWQHLCHQRPLAAWASWQRALRIAPKDRAACEALDRLASAVDLPAAARATYRFRTPRGDDRRARWDARLQGQGLEELVDAAATFGELAADDPADASARYNQALCLAWLGRNAEAIAALDHAVSLEAADHFDDAVDAWTLAEVLRQGAGAEELADDFTHFLTISWSPEDGDPAALAPPGLMRPLPSPLGPAAGATPVPDARVYQWLDRPMPAPSVTLAADDLPRVLASVVQTAGALRLSTPQPLGRHADEFTRALGDRGHASRWQATPLPLGLLDAALWTFRLPPGLDDEARRRLCREAVEDYFETEWIHLGRLGLGRRPGAPGGLISGTSPLEAGRRAAGGDAVARVKLTAVIRVREQLAARPRTAGLYAGYPFDRLRRRVGLEPRDATTIDPADVSCMDPEELGRLDPSVLDDHTLADAYRSALALLDDAVAARMAAALVQRDPTALVRVDPPGLAGTLSRQAWIGGDLAGALSWLDRAIAADIEAHAGRHHETYMAWRAQVRALADDPEAALACYQAAPAGHPNPAAPALEVAAALRGGGHRANARRLARRARDLTLRARDAATEARASASLADQSEALP